ncbi:phytosulfokine receptor 1 [Mercurialis annua]|uniref:phytosulfokine receptor 1 n=1 Tax=Mercurialis annua TaxID=3986 RepID=UPI00215F2A5D|nr:phytosulfokine receptor 1 [Mercurialis annua]
MGVWAMLIVSALWLHVNSATLCNENDTRALEDFMHGLQSPIPQWGSDNCCLWSGITCSNTTSSPRVAKLELPNQRLTGRLPESLGNLDHLTTLNLSRNFLKDSLPFSLFHLPKLQLLDLSFNDFTDSIPLSINLPSLSTLDISSNNLNGSLPTLICQNSTQLQIIRMAVNYFSGPLLLSGCASLEHLCLGMNNLSGGISDNIFHLQKLNLLDLQDNKLSGQLSPGIGRLLSLERLDLSSNYFSGPIPDVFHLLPKFKFFIGHSNGFLGTIPPSLLNSPSLKLLNLRNNSLDGGVDRFNCSVMTSLDSLDLGSNKFKGLLPANLPSCKYLKNINLARNNFSGQIPESFRNFESLSYLSLSNTSIHNLASALQILQHCKNLTTLVLTLNFRGEQLPALPALRFDNLKVLVIASCRLTGSIPLWLRNSTNLQLLDLSWNHLSGTIPVWFGDFLDFFYLDLSNNSFVGEIPKSLTQLPSLISRNISLVEPSSDFPFFMRRNETRGLRYNQVLSFPPTLDLSHNNLTGFIWPEFGNLKKLHILDLKYNEFSGSIPSEISGMSSLETLDLSHNNLSGAIPSSLVGLSFLSKFNVAHNNLSGRIPVGGQFLTFPNSSFEGNDLCGDHGMPPCVISDQVPPEAHVKSRRNRDIIIGMVVGIVLGTSFLVVVMFMIVLRAHNRGEVDPEKEGPDTEDKEVGELGSKLVVLFHTKENCKELSLEDLLKSTNNFDQANIIGCGGFGLVYKATLPDGRKVAIKRLSGDSCQMDREFQAEVETLSRAQHPNLVHLQGYCAFNNDRLLIYSYMENSSLDYWLHENMDGTSALDWSSRLRIARGAARGLAYLHQSCEPHIVHRDIKSSNILLNEDFEAHLADFGLARLIKPYETHVTTDLVGTLGYIPPEYGQASVATYKGDVYSFGVVLLELLTGKRPMDICKPRGLRDMVSWVLHMKKEGRQTEVFDPFIYDKENDKQLLQVLDIACLCLSEIPKMRPSTMQLVSWLNTI